MSVKPSLPKGTRDLLPEAMQKREYITSIIKEVFGKYGYVPIETPAMEKLDTLTGKYGEEGDKLIFSILNSGDKLSKNLLALFNLIEKEKQEHEQLISDESQDKALSKLADKLEGKDVVQDADYPDLSKFISKNLSFLAEKISEKALRYDLTVPFARFVVQNQNEISFPFKRYQIQPVWRADRPQKGRFREFYQCDADAVGSDSLLLELEFIRIYDEVFRKLGLQVSIHLNNRKLLAGLAESLGIEDRLGEFTVILDKLDKIGIDKLLSELNEKGFSAEVGEALKAILEQEGSNSQKLEAFASRIESSEIGKKGIEEVSFLLDNLDGLKLDNEVVLDVSLARGLDYYTGAIFEVKAKDVAMGSIGGGGRYDDLTGIFGLKGISGTGISFGLDRIQMVMEELGAFPDIHRGNTEVLFVNFGEKEALYSLHLSNELRDMGIKAEVYPDSAKLRKQMDYANKRSIPRVIMIGSEEMKQEKFSLKDMESGKQSEYSRIELLELFSNQRNHYGRH